MFFMIMVQLKYVTNLVCIVLVLDELSLSYKIHSALYFIETCFFVQTKKDCWMQGHLKNHRLIWSEITFSLILFMIMVQLKYVTNLVCVVLVLDMFSLSNNPTDILLHRNLFFCPNQKGLLDARVSKNHRLIIK